MASSQNQHRFRLSYELVLCAKCGLKRVRGVTCADCAAQPAPWEVDQRAVARRGAVRAAATLLNVPPKALPLRPFRVLEMEELMNRLHSWLSDFFSAIGAVSSARLGAEDSLLRVTQELLAERAFVSSAARYRPWTPLVDGSRRCVEHLREMALSYLDALSASTPLEAQRHAERAQQQMDAAADVLGRHAQRIERLSELLDAGGFQDQLVVLLLRAMQDMGAGDLTKLGTRAETEVAAVVGSAPGHGCGVGLQFALQRAAVATYGDVRRFEQIVRSSAELVARSPELLSALASSPSFVTDIEAALLDIFDASSQAAQVLDSNVPRQIGRSLVDVAASLVEGPGQMVAIALLVGSGQKTRPYEKLRQDNATELLRSARKQPAMEPLLEGLNLDLRTAQAHRMVRYADDGLTMEIKSVSQALTWDELSDELFMACESAMGCLIGLMHALSRLGHSFGHRDGYRAFGISPEAMLSATLRLMGCSNVSLEETRGTWRVTLTVPVDTQLTVLAAGVAALVPQDISTLTVIADSSGNQHILSGPVALLRPFSDTTDPDNDQYGIAATRMQRLWTYDGKPCIEEALVRAWAAQQVVTALSGDAQSIARLRALRTLAFQVDDTELAEALTAAIRSTRLGGTADRETQELVAKLAAWGSTPVPYQPV
ncbi:hypothetical protein [Streptomyces sp. IB2014 016-6]|uniref:hypothetical protein n=1 Tax=Streptomyces sp. IB2014 016-6 TaxID=2517818 RepID=UPI0011CA45EF|nr:hypothetical protein [Streptomyces sp. IB2014 016-6]TXL88053.1 hypothetical protein EW053_19505 [Streptomyces sp. IB2014 016-6]